MTYWCIYRITNNINGKTYIGQHKYTNEDDPMQGYHGGGKLLHYAYNKYGIENFSTEVLYRRIQYKETADSMEIWMIEKERKSNTNGCYNIADGGRGSSGVPAWNRGKSPSNETRLKMSKAHKGRIVAEETRKKLSKAHKGKKLSEEQKRKVGEWSKRMWQNEEYRQMQIDCHKGKKLSEDHKRKISEGNKGKIVSDETKRKLSEAARNRKVSDEIRKKLSESHKGKSPGNKGKKMGHWYNNGVECVLSFECPEGFVPGRLPRRKS